MITDPDRICFAGDWHGNGPWGVQMIEHAKANGAQVILHTGDFGFTFNHGFLSHIRHALDDNDMYLYFVDGNHDDQPQLFRRWSYDEDGFATSPYGGRGWERLFYIPRGHRWTWNGKVFMGLGGAVSVDRAWREPGKSWWKEEPISDKDVATASRKGRVDVMITHDIPAEATLPNVRKSAGWPDDVMADSAINRYRLQRVVNAIEPTLLVHGHFHSRFRQNVGQLRIESLDKDESSVSGNLFYINADLTEHEPTVDPRQSHYESLFRAMENDDDPTE